MAYSESLYDRESRHLVYNDMIRRANVTLASGRSVVLDGTFLSAQYRSQARSAALTHGAIPTFIRCKCPTEMALARIERRSAKRDSLSEAYSDIYQRKQDEDEPDPPGVESVTITTDEPLSVLLELVMTQIRASYASSLALPQGLLRQN